MSLVRIAIRIAAVEALKGKTLVGDNVLDSEIGVIDVNADGGINIEEKKPFIAVYSDTSVVLGSDNELRSLTNNGTIDLMFEAGVTSGMVERDENGDASLIGFDFPDTDRAIERQLDMIVRQMFVALTDPYNDWAQIFKNLSFKFSEVRRGRISTESGGLRRAAQQVSIKVDLVADPVWGGALKPISGLGRFLAKLESSASEEYQKLAQVMRQQLGDPTDEAEGNQRRYGMTLDEMNAMLLTVPGEGAP